MTAIRNVYVVDDDSMVRRSTVMMLNASGWRARPFDGGRAFLEERAWLEQGCLLLDIRMPDVDGFGVLNALGDDVTRFPPVMMTGHGDIAIAVQAMKMGATDFLEKPFEDTALFDILGRLGDRLACAERDMDERGEAARRIAALTAREGEVLNGLVDGLPNKIIADRLSLSVRTVEMHRAHLMEKLGVRALADALKLVFLANTKAM